MRRSASKADIKVTDDEVTQALVERVRQFPGQEQQVWEFYRKNPQALAEIRAPIFEEKVVDHILAQVKVADEPVSKEELFSDDEDDGEDGPTAAPDGRRRNSHPEKRRSAPGPAVAAAPAIRRSRRGR